MWIILDIYINNLIVDVVAFDTFMFDWGTHVGIVVKMKSIWVCIAIVCSLKEEPCIDWASNNNLETIIFNQLEDFIEVSNDIARFEEAGFTFEFGSNDI